MTRRHLPVLALLLSVAVSAFGQTAGEKQSFEMMKRAAESYMASGNYTAAKAQYNGIFRLFPQYKAFTDEITPNYRKCVNELNRQQNENSKDNERLILSEQIITFSHSAGSQVVNVLAGKNGNSPWEIKQSPDWVSIAKTDGGFMVSAVDNPEPVMRGGEVVVTMSAGGKKTVSREIPVFQIGRPLQERSVRIITNPEGAQVTIGNDPTPRRSPLTIQLTEGEIPVHILRNDYFPLDTHITVSIDDDPKITKEYKFDLSPCFAIAKLTFKAASGYLDDKNPRLYIDGKQINLDAYYGRSGVQDFNQASGFSYYLEMYRDSDRNFVIPLKPGTYVVTAFAEDFEDYSQTFAVREGETIPMDVVMTPKHGTIRFFAGQNAEGTVIKDGRTPVGTLTTQLDVPLTADEHKFYFEKQDFVSEVPFYSIRVNSDETQDFEVNMIPLSYLTILTDPAGAEVLFNDVSDGIRTPVLNRAVPLGRNNITIRQQGYYPAVLETNSIRVGQQDTLRVKLRASHPLHIKSDAFRSTRCAATGFNVYLRLVGDAQDQVREYDHFTDTVLNLPYGTYKYEFRRYSRGPEPGYDYGVQLSGDRRRKDLAYKGTFRFREGHDVLRRMSYSESGCVAALTGDLFLNDISLTAEDGSAVCKDFARLSLLKFPLWKGFSTSLVQAEMFQNAPGASPSYLFSGTCFFLNGEQRIGGGILQNLDVNLLAAYSILPHFKNGPALRDQGINFTYVDKTDLFVGLELHSRLPALNVNFKCGYRYLNGNVCTPSNTGKTYEYQPFGFNGLSASVGFTLGGKDDKGAHTIRVFYL